MGRKAAGVISLIIDRSLLVVFLVIMGIGIYCLLDARYVKSEASGERFYVNRPARDAQDAYTGLGEETVGWLRIPGTGIDYPLMQAKDNFKYLNTAPDGSYSLSGSIFLDYRCAPDFSDPYTLIYGHHMEDGLLFGALDAFMDESYLKEHREAELSFSGKTHRAVVFACMRSDARNPVLFEPTFYDEQYDFIRENAFYFEEPLDRGHIAALSTCTEDAASTERTLVFLSFERE